MSCYEMESEPLDEIFGFHMDYPTADEVHRFKGTVSWEERFECFPRVSTGGLC